MIYLILIGWVIVAGLFMFGFFRYFGKKYKMQFFFDSLRKGELNTKEIIIFILYILFQIIILLIAGLLIGYTFMIEALN